MQMLLENLACIDKLRAVADRAEHRLHHFGLGWPSRALTQQPDKRVLVRPTQPPCPYGPVKLPA